MSAQGVVALLGLQGVLTYGVPVAHSALLRLVKAQREGDCTTAEDDLLFASGLLWLLLLLLQSQGLLLLLFLLSQGQRLLLLPPLWLWERVFAVAFATDGRGGNGTRGASEAAGPLPGDVAAA